MVREIHTGEYDPTWFAVEAWFAVEVVGETQSGGAQCKCLNCGHEWISKSIAAKRVLDYLKKAVKRKASKLAAQIV